MFWTNEKTASIYIQSTDGKSYTALLSKNIRPSELVIMPVERSVGQSVKMLRSMMHFLMLLIHFCCFLPPSVMFWINAGPGDRVTIEKSWMDGSERSSLAVITAQSAHSLTADVAARRLYWISDVKRVSF